MATPSGQRFLDITRALHTENGVNSRPCPDELRLKLQITYIVAKFIDRNCFHKKDADQNRVEQKME